MWELIYIGDGSDGSDGSDGLIGCSRVYNTTHILDHFSNGDGSDGSDGMIGYGSTCTPHNLENNRIELYLYVN